MTKISVLGLGAMGSRMAANLLKAGHSVTVWNRTPAAVATLVSNGAKQAGSPREAAAGADFVLAMVRDDEASREVWLSPKTGALAGMDSRAVAIESSTLTATWVRELGGAANEWGVPLIEAPVVGSRPQADAGQLIYFTGGEEAILRRVEPILKVLGGAIHFVGPLGSAALVKLATNALMGVQVTVLAEIIGLFHHSGLDSASAIKAISSTSAWSPAANYLTGTMLTENFAPQFPVTLIEKDFGYVLRGLNASKDAPTIAAARSVFQRAVECGLGADNMTGVVRLFTR